MDKLNYENITLSWKIDSQKKTIRFYKNGDLYKGFHHSWDDLRKKHFESFDTFLSRARNDVVNQISRTGWKLESHSENNDELKFVRKHPQDTHHKIAAHSVHKYTGVVVQVILDRYLSGANTTNISKFLQKELHLDPHEAARAINTRVIASIVSQEQGKELQDKLKDYKVESTLKTIKY